MEDGRAGCNCWSRSNITQLLRCSMPERQQNVSLTACCCRMNTNFWACCFKAPERIPGKQIVSGFQLDEETEADICSGAYCPA